MKLSVLGWGVFSNDQSRSATVRGSSGFPRDFRTCLLALGRDCSRWLLAGSVAHEPALFKQGRQPRGTHRWEDPGGGVDLLKGFLRACPVCVLLGLADSVPEGSVSGHLGFHCSMVSVTPA